jgi:hypothetical protein
VNREYSHQAHLFLYRHLRSERWLVDRINAFNIRFRIFVMAECMAVEHYMIACVGALVLVTESDDVPCNAISGLPRPKVPHSIVFSADELILTQFMRHQQRCKLAVEEGIISRP